jgi:hypothetical protein
MTLAVEVIRIAGPVPVMQLAIWKAPAVRDGIAHKPVLLQLLESDGNDDPNCDVVWQHFFTVHPTCAAVVSKSPEGVRVWYACPTVMLRAYTLRHFTQA